MRSFDQELRQSRILFVLYMLFVVGVYYFLDGMTHAEIARILGCSRRTVGNRIEALRAQVQRELGPSQELGR